jgi:hypothetical protein
MPRARRAPTWCWTSTRRRPTVRVAQGRLRATHVFLRESILYGAFVRARRALNRRKWRWFPARAAAEAAANEPQPEPEAHPAAEPATPEPAVRTP